MLFLELAGKHNKTPAQIVLRWHLQHEVVIIPKSSHPHRIRENADIFDYQLSVEDMQRIDGLADSSRQGMEEGTFDYWDQLKKK